MDELLLTPDQRWHGTGLTAAWFREKAEWIQRDSGAPGAIDHFFNSTARLLRLCWYDYMLLGPMVLPLQLVSPWIFKYPVPITEQNARVQYGQDRQILSLVKLLGVTLCAFLVWQSS